MTMEKFLVFLLLCLAKEAIGAPSEKQERDEDVIRYTLRRDLDQDWDDELNDPECLTAQKIVEDTKKMVQNALPDILVDLQNPKFLDENGKVTCLVTLALRGLRDHSKKALEKRFTFNIPGATISHTGELFDPCTAVGQCTPDNSHCDLAGTETCICDEGYVSSTDSRDTCFAVVGVGEVCERQFQCSGHNSLCSADPDNAAQKKCQCEAGYTLPSDSTDCAELAANLLDSCTAVEQCAIPFPNSKCISHKCQCDDGYLAEDGQCIMRATLSPRECGDGSLGGGFCLPPRCPCGVTNSECVSEECVCSDGYDQVDDECLPECSDGSIEAPCELPRCGCSVDNSECVAEKCQCSDGFEKVGAACLEECGTPVLHGDCDSRCTCDGVEGATCDPNTGKCVCNNDRMELHGDCVERKNTGEVCTYSEQCPAVHQCAVATGETEKTCICADGYVMLTGAGCLVVNGLGGECDYNIQCQGTGMECSLEKCSCVSIRAPSLSNPGTCVLKKRSSVSSFKVSLNWNEDFADPSSDLYAQFVAWVLAQMSSTHDDITNIVFTQTDDGKSHVQYRHTVPNEDADLSGSGLRARRSPQKNNMMKMKRHLTLAAKRQGLDVSDFNTEIEKEE